MHTKQSIRQLLAKNDKAVERAMIRLFERQTEDEKAQQQTTHLNYRGFSPMYAPKGTYMARWILSGRSLTGKFLVIARKIAMHHAGQLADIANKKAEKQMTFQQV